MYTVHCTVIATCIMCTLYTRVGAWVSPPEVENELLKCCLYTLQGGVEGGCPPPLSFSFSCPGQYKPCTGPGLGWSCLACFRSFQKSAPDESSRMSQQIFLLPFPFLFLLWKLPEVCAWWVIKDESSVIACGKVLKTNICIAFPHEIACGEVIKTNIFITFPHEIACGKVIKIFVLPGVYKRGCSWTPAQFPFGNQRSNTSGEKLLLGKS